MKKESEFSQYFDDDFEVTYDEYMTDTESWDMTDETDATEDYDTDYDETDYDDEDTLPGSVKQKKASKKRRSRGVPFYLCSFFLCRLSFIRFRARMECSCRYAFLSSIYRASRFSFR